MAINQKASTNHGSPRTEVKEKKARKKNDESLGTKKEVKERTEEGVETKKAIKKGSIGVSTVKRKVKKVFKKA